MKIVPKPARRTRYKIVRTRRVRYRISPAGAGESSPRGGPSPAPVLVVDPVKLEASLCRESFYDFVQRFWGEVYTDEPVWNWHIEFLCKELQYSAERVFQGLPREHDICVNIPPGSTKSAICSVLFPAWVWTRMPAARFICVSHTKELARDDFALKSRDVVLSDKWNLLFGDVELREDSSAKGYYLNKHGGFRYSTGTGGKITGKHAHFLILDDPLDPEMSYSEAELKRALRWQTQTLPTRKVDKAVALTVLIMQRLHRNDSTAIMLQKAKDAGVKVRHICLPGEIWEAGPKAVSPRRVAKYYVDGMLDPVRLGRHVLQEQKSVLGPYGYACQIAQNPIPLGGGMFKVERIAFDQPPARAHFKKLCRFWDKAATKDAGAWTAGILIGKDADDHFWVLDVVRGQWDTATREKIIRHTAEVDGLRVEIGLEQEPGSGGKDSAIATVKNLAGFRVRVVRPTGSKSDRADPFSVAVNSGLVRIPTGAHWASVFIEELRAFDEDSNSYKDQVDASAGAFNVITRVKKKVGGLWQARR